MILSTFSDANVETDTMTLWISYSKLFSLLLAVALLAAVSHSALAQQLPPVVVKTYGQHFGGHIVYQQEVTNTGNRNVVDIAIGQDTDEDGTETGTRDSGELD